MPSTKIYATLKSERSEILQQWVQQLLSSSSNRADLLSESELRVQAERFLSSLTEATASGITSIHAPEFADVLDYLAELSAARGRQGFSPVETATFVFSLKEPVFGAMRRTYSGADERLLLDDTLALTSLLDQLGLHTTAVFQQAREEVIHRQQEEMLELSTPVVQLWDGIVALPLIGTLDSARTSVVMETLLQTIVETRSEIAIIDITGVPTVDTLVAQHLLKPVAAARLMGADCIISGIRPQIAQTMVHLQIDLSTVSTKASMADALREAMRRSGFAVVKSKAA